MVAFRNHILHHKRSAVALSSRKRLVSGVFPQLPYLFFVIKYAAHLSETHRNIATMQKPGGHSIVRMRCLAGNLGEPLIVQEGSPYPRLRYEFHFLPSTSSSLYSDGEIKYAFFVNLEFEKRG